MDDYEIFEVVEIGDNDATKQDSDYKELIGLRVRKFGDIPKQEFDGWFTGNLEIVSNIPTAWERSIYFHGTKLCGNPRVVSFYQVKLKPIE